MSAVGKVQGPLRLVCSEAHPRSLVRRGAALRSPAFQLKELVSPFFELGLLLGSNEAPTANFDSSFCLTRSMYQ